MDQTLIDVSSTFIENIFRSGLTLLSCNDIIIIIKVDKKIVKNHKKINKQKRLFKKNWLSNGQKGNELRSWDGKKIICKYSLLKKCFETIIIAWACFCQED